MSDRRKVERRKPGRPSLDEHDPSVEVCVTLPSKQYDDLYARAKQARLRSVPELIRRVLLHQPAKQ